jgi:hypothetical protein
MAKRPYKKPPPKVTEQQMTFVDVYLETGNKRQAAKAAGYGSWETNYGGIFRARGIQHELMRRAMENRDHAPLTPGYILSGLQEVAERCMQSAPVVDAKGKPVVATQVDDDGNEVSAALYTFDARGAISAFTKLGDHLRMWNPQPEDKDREARNRSIQAELKRIADAVEGKHDTHIEAAPVKTGDEGAPKPNGRLN